jgi:YidC/Oxa1 family membrane protein insertase
VSFDFFSLDYIYYPVSGIMWVWHKVFGAVLGSDNPWAWVLSVVFLVFTLRSLLFKPFMKQMTSQMKMQAVAPEMKRLREKYKGDRTRLAEEMQKFNKEAGVNPLGGCLPALIQAPVFIGLFHVLRSFKPHQARNYFFDGSDVDSFVGAKLFHGAPLSAYMTIPANSTPNQIGLIALEGVRSTIIAVGIPLTILAGIATYLTSRRSVARQEQMQGANDAAPQAAIMNKLMKYVFPLFVVVGGPFFPLAILFYWLSNNTWTFGQLYVAHRIQDKQLANESMVIDEAKKANGFTKPQPGARPTVDTRPVTRPAPGSRPGQGSRPAPGGRPAAGAKPASGVRQTGGARPARPTGGSSPATGARPTTGASPANGAKPTTGARSTGSTKRAVVQPTTRRRGNGAGPDSAPSNGSTAAGDSGDSAASNGSSNGTPPSLRKGGVDGGSTGSDAFSTDSGSPTQQTGGSGTTARKKKPGRR